MELLGTYACIGLSRHMPMPWLNVVQHGVSPQAPVKIAVIFKQLRILIDSVLRKKLENPKMSLESKCFIVIQVKEVIHLYTVYIEKKIYLGIDRDR